jgi:hypothetical protein
VPCRIEIATLAMPDCESEAVPQKPLVAQPAFHTVLL